MGDGDLGVNIPLPGLWVRLIWELGSYQVEGEQAERPTVWAGIQSHCLLVKIVKQSALSEFGSESPSKRGHVSSVSGTLTP